MDAREREDSHSRRPSNKRPWEEDIVVSDEASIWSGTRLPPIDSSLYRRPSLPPRVTEPDDIWGNQYDSESRDGGAKRARCEGHDYSVPRESLDVSGKSLRTQASRKLSDLALPLPSLILYNLQIQCLLRIEAHRNYLTPTYSSSLKGGELQMQGELHWKEFATNAKGLVRSAKSLHCC